MRTCETIESPASSIGLILVAADDRGVTHVRFAEDAREVDGFRERAERATGARPGPGGLAGRAAAQIAEYLAGTRPAFDLPLAAAGTEWQHRVWDALTEVPWGTTARYGEIAARIGRPQAARAVGATCGRNPIAIVVPCHRIVGATGALTGYAGGLHRKEWLLAHEGARLRSAEPRPRVAATR